MCVSPLPRTIGIKTSIYWARLETFVDLCTGILHEPRPEDGITKLTSATPSQEADCPLWFKFLDEVTRGDNDLIYYLQVLNGYSLTGSIEEHLLAFLYGPGGNGKGVYLNTMAGISGSYAAVALWRRSHFQNTTATRQIWQCCVARG